MLFLFSIKKLFSKELIYIYHARYQPNFSALRGAINQALYSKNSHKQWQVCSISQSQQSSSIYAYVYRAGRLAAIRLSTHTASENNVRIISAHVHHPDNSHEAYNRLKDNDQVRNALINQSISLDLPVLMMTQAIAKTFKTKQTFFWHYNQLIVTHPQRKITDSAVCKIIADLIDLRLLIWRPDGHLSVTHNGRTILTQYHLFARGKKGWPWKLGQYSCDDLLFMLGRYYGHKIAQEGFSESLTLQLEQLPTPSNWRVWGQAVANKHDWFPYQVLSTISPARRRSLYFYLYSPRTAQLMLLRVGVSELENTPLPGFPRHVSNTVVVPGKEAGQLQNTISELTPQRLISKEFSAFRLHLLHFLWLRTVLWASNHHAQFSFTDAVTITKKDHTGKLVAYYCLPGHHWHWLDGLERFKLIKLGSKPEVTPLGRLLLTKYDETQPYQPSTWKKNLLTGISRAELFDVMTSD